jgi:hypothetical protein
MFTVFDFAEPDQVNGQRNVTTVPTQALFFLNNPFVAKAAKECAERLFTMNDATDEERVKHAYAGILGRFPTTEEIERALSFVQEDAVDRKSPEGWPAFVQALYASAEFRYVP